MKSILRSSDKHLCKYKSERQKVKIYILLCLTQMFEIMKPIKLTVIYSLREYVIELRFVDCIDNL